MLDSSTVWTVVFMALGTYCTRIAGYLALRGRNLSPRANQVLHSMPGCVLIAVIAPSFVPERPIDWLALVITMAAASRLSILPTVLIGITATGVLRHL